MVIRPPRSNRRACCCNSAKQAVPQRDRQRYDWVGRNLQGHAYPAQSASSTIDTYDDVGPGARIAVSDYNHGTPGLSGGGMLANEFIRLPYPVLDRVSRRICRAGARPTNKPCAPGYKRTSWFRGPRRRYPSFEARFTSIPMLSDTGDSVAAHRGQRHPHTFADRARS